MGEAVQRSLHLVDGCLLDTARPSTTRGRGHGAEDERALALAAFRVARPIVDRLDRRERGRVAALVACVSDPRPHLGGVVARLAVGGLSLASTRALHVSGVPSCGMFTALHVARAVLHGSAGARVLVISLAGDGAGAVLLGEEGPTLCRPLPPVSVELTADGVACAPLYGAALARAMAGGAVQALTVDRVAGPAAAVGETAEVLRLAGLGHTLGAPAAAHPAPAETSEEVMARAALRPPEGRTLVWSHGPRGRVGACILEPS